MFETVAWDRLTLSNKKVFVGHCRKATVGGVSKMSAHPFSYDHITGVHNGTLNNWRSLPGTNEITDSAMLYKNFAETGVRPTIEAVDGAYALIWWDEREGMLNVLKNDKRPLFYCFSEDTDRIFWASEAWMLSIALSRNNVKMANVGTEKEPAYIKPVEDDTWWRVRPNGRGSKKGEHLTFFDDEDLKGGVKKPAYSYSQAPFQGGWQAWSDPNLDDDLPDTLLVVNKKDPDEPRLLTNRDTTSTAGGSGSTTQSGKSEASKGSSSTSAATPSRDQKPLLSLVPSSKSGSSALPKEYLEGNGGLVLTEEEFNMLVDPNCIWCSQPHDYNELKDQGKLGAWVSDEEYICSGCVHSPEVASAF